MVNEEIKHYGVLGMKWGVRRLKNKNNSIKSNKRINAQKNEFKIAKNHKENCIEILMIE